MILYANGCSWTWGGGLEPYFGNDEERLKLLWPHHLGKKMNCSEVVNQSDGCGSNQRIVRTTFEWLQTKGLDELKETVAVIQLTSPARFEYYQPEIKEWAKCKIDCCIQTSEDPDKALARANHRLETFTELEGTHVELMTIFSLAKMFEIFQIKKYFIWGMHGINLSHFNSQVLENFSFVDFRNVKGGSGAWPYQIIGKVPSGHIDYHPSVVGHKELAEIIFKKIIGRL